MIYRSRFVVLVALVSLLVAAACTSDEENGAESPAPTATPSATSEASATPEPVGTTTPDSGVPRRSGDPALDAIIEAIAARDMAAIASLVTYQEIGCTHAEGLGGPPKCEAAHTEGEVLRVFPVAESHGYWTDTAVQTLGGLAHSARGLYLAATVEGDADLGGEWPEADAILQFHTDWFGQPSSARLHVSDGRIVAVWFGAGPTDPANLTEAGIQGGVTVIAGPWDEPTEVKETVPSIDNLGVDVILEAIARYDVVSLDEPARRGMAAVADVPCVATIMESGEIDCDPKNGEEPGTPVDVFPAAYCHGTVSRDPMPTLRAVLEGAPVLHSVLRAPEEPSPSEVYQHGDYWLIYEMTSPEYPWEALRLHVSDSGELLLVWFGCGPTLRELVEWEGAPLPRVDVTEVAVTAER